MSPFIVPSLKKIVGANLEKIDKVDFRDIHTYIQTYIHPDKSDLIGPFPTGVQKSIHYPFFDCITSIVSLNICTDAVSRHMMVLYRPCVCNSSVSDRVISPTNLLHKSRW